MECSGIFIAGTLGVDMAKVIPYLFFPIALLVVNLFFNITEIGTSKLDNEDKEERKVKKGSIIFNIFSR